MTKPNFTSINVVLDRSGSMYDLINDTIGGFNTFLNAQKAEPGEAVFTLAMFDTCYDLVHDCAPIAQVPELTTETYKTGGNTALLDAIARTINATGSKLAAMKEEDRPSKVIVMVITDGEENASREFMHSKVMELINHQRDKYSWEFVFMGAQQDAIQTGASLGFGASNSYHYTSSSVGTKRLFSNASAGSNAYRRSLNTNERFKMANPDLDTIDTSLVVASSDNDALSTTTSAPEDTK